MADRHAADIINEWPDESREAAQLVLAGSQPAATPFGPGGLAPVARGLYSEPGGSTWFAYVWLVVGSAWRRLIWSCGM